MIDQEDASEPLPSTLQKAKDFLHEQHNKFESGLYNSNLMGKQDELDIDEYAKNYFSNIQYISGLEHKPEPLHPIEKVAEVIDDYAASLLDRLYKEDKEGGTTFYGEWLDFLQRNKLDSDKLMSVVRQNGCRLYAQEYKAEKYEDAYEIFKASVDVLQNVRNFTLTAATDVHDFLRNYGLPVLKKYIKTLPEDGLYRRPRPEEAAPSRKKFDFYSDISDIVETYGDSVEIIKNTPSSPNSGIFINNGFEYIDPLVAKAKKGSWNYNKEGKYKEYLSPDIESAYNFCSYVIAACHHTYSKEEFKAEINSYIPKKMNEFFDYRNGEYTACLYKQVTNIFKDSKSARQDFSDDYGMKIARDMIKKDYLIEAGEILQQIKKDFRIPHWEAVVLCDEGVPLATMFNVGKQQGKEYNQHVMVVFDSTNTTYFKDDNAEAPLFEPIQLGDKKPKKRYYKERQAWKMQKRALEMKDEFGLPQACDRGVLDIIRFTINPT